MSFTFQNPTIDTSSMDEKEQLRVMQSWLYQLTDELRHALNNLNAGDIYFENEYSPINSNVTKRQRQNIADGYSSLKDLIINTAEKVDAAADVIRRELRSDYVAESEFGTYRAEVSNEITETANGITSNFYAKGVIDKRIGEDGSIYASEGEDESKTTSQYIKCGYLFDDEGGNRRYGVAVGENLTLDSDGAVVRQNLATTMTSDRVSFWNGSIEVAYISNKKLYITEAEIIDRLKVGNWSIETDNGFAIKWMGVTQ